MSEVPWIRRVALVEGIAFLALLGVAMPLKYVWDLPVAVKIAGPVHGALFLVLCWQLMGSELPRKLRLTVLVAALLPFGTFFVDRQLRDAATS